MSSIEVREVLQFEVVMRSKDGGRWSLLFYADDFSHAYEQAIDYLAKDDPGKHWEIIRIEKDYA
jgi:hypothetical protein